MYLCICSYKIPYLHGYSPFLTYRLALAQQGNFLNRLTMLFAVNTLSTVVPAAVIAALFVPAVCSLKADPVANIRFVVLPFVASLFSLFYIGIRFNVAKTLELVLPSTPKAVFQSHIRPALQQLANDDDPDCQFYAHRALQGWYSCLMGNACLPRPCGGFLFCFL
jgi:hypothetical protein